MTKVIRQDKTLDARTAAQFDEMVRRIGDLTVYQGCFNPGGVSQSGGTHDGSGAIDIGPNDGQPMELIEQTGRLLGLAMWYRPRLVIGTRVVWGAHCHGISIGSKLMSDAARKQVQDYFADLDGLAGHRPDPSPKPNPIVRFKYPLPWVDLDQVRREAKKSRGWEQLVDVRHIQRTLNLKTGTTLITDGVYGPNTRRALGRWEKQNGGDGDGIPGNLLDTLGAARFRVRSS
jgi:hypothetical protein